MAGVAAPLFVESKVSQRPVILFSKSYCPDSKRVKLMLKDEYKLDNKSFEVVNIERRQDVNQIEDYFMMFCLSEKRELPQLWVGGKYIGNEFKVNHLHNEGQLSTLLNNAGLSVPAINAQPAAATKDVTEEKTVTSQEEIKILEEMQVV